MATRASNEVRDPFGVRGTVEAGGHAYSIYSLPKLTESGVANIDRLPFVVRIMLENLLRHVGTEFATADDVTTFANWDPAKATPDIELAYLPARVILQDFTGVPCVVDLAAMRSAVARMGGDVSKINPLVPVDLVIDHSVQVDRFGTMMAFGQNVAFEYERNRERYMLLRWAQEAMQNFRVVPPGTGIVHQVNLEYLASVVASREIDGEMVAFPDTLVGTDSHTTMISGLGVLGWGVGGIEAEAVLLGQPLYQLMPEVVGVKLSGQLEPGATATDLVLRVTEMLRSFGVVGRFVEFFGAGLSSLPLADRATIANMSPEYGATTGFFPVDDVTLGYLRKTGRSTEQVDLVERYCKQQGLFRTDATPDPVYNAVLELDLGSIRPSVAGPRRPQDRIELDNVKSTFRAAYADRLPSANGEEAPLPGVPIKVGESIAHVRHGSVVIAAITSCTNTSNPSVMLGAGLLAKKAVERGLDVAPYVKTSLAPGSQVVTRYLDQSGLTGYLEALGFHTVGYGCTTCIGNSGPLPGAVAEAVDDNELVVAAVLSGNRNFEGRVHQQVRASFLASPPLVVAYALAGTVDIDLARDPLGIDPNSQPVYLADIWPTRDEVEAVVAENVTSEMFQEEYATVFDGDDRWKTLPVPTGELYHWDPESTYVQEPPYFIDMSPEPQPVHDIAGARVLVLVGDSVTTDHISPAGAIARTSPAAQYLVNNDVEPRDFNSYGSRRGNHEVMVRGTFANIRLRNLLVPGKEGNLTVYLPTGEEMSIYDASYLYQRENIPLLAIAGKEYGSGSSRDWAAKGPMLLGIKAIIAESYERIHRSNLIGMGVLPLQFKPGENLSTFGLNGTETFAISGIADNLTPRKVMTVTATKSDGSTVSFEAVARIDSKVEVGYYKNGGILQTVLRRLMAS
ncbi:MAG TPA: aconitate hydratase AcnA [Thermomicrobiales bacterium]|nr:aconitate hydratase AcnA [Thermomicrobiales bacterium]